MKRKKIVLAFLLLSLVMSMGIPLIGVAQETLHSITIVKYRIPEGAQLTPRPVDQRPGLLEGRPGNVYIGSQGLERMAGVQFQVVRMMEQGNAYVPMTGNGAFVTTVTTDGQGIARVERLPEGIYRVATLAHDRLPVLEEATIISFPLTDRDGQLVRDVYIYPKSGFVPPVETPGTPGMEINKSTANSVLPGGDLTYTITVRNTGNTVLSGVSVRDDLPVTLRNPRNLVMPENATGGFAGQVLTVNIPSLGIGETATIRFTVTVASDVVAGQVIRNTAVATTDCGEREEDEETTTVGQEPVQDPPRPPEPPPEQKPRLPQTDGELGGLRLFLLAGGMFALAGIGLYLVKRKGI